MFYLFWTELDDVKVRNNYEPNLVGHSVYLIYADFRPYCLEIKPKKQNLMRSEYTN